MRMQATEYRAAPGGRTGVLILHMQRGACTAQTIHMQQTQPTRGLLDTSTGEWIESLNTQSNCEMRNICDTSWVHKFHVKMNLEFQN